MQLLDFVKVNDLLAKTQSEQAKMLCFYHFKECGEDTFTTTLISKLMINAGFNKPNLSRLKDSLIKGKGKAFLTSVVDKGALQFIPVTLQEMERSFGQQWENRIIVVSDSELIDETKFCGKRGYLTQLIKQINSSYKNNCYDACAVLMRRLFEVLLIHVYQNFNIEGSIKSAEGKYHSLEKIVSDAKGNNTLNLSYRVKKDLDVIRGIGNLSAHSITYAAGRKDIDDIKINYRVALEELFNKAGLI